MHPLPFLLLILLSVSTTIHSAPLSLKYQSRPPPHPRLVLRSIAPPWTADHEITNGMKVCPSQYPLGFAVICDPNNNRAIGAKVVFMVDGQKVKEADPQWFGPYEMDGYFRSSSVVWEGYVTGNRVGCKLKGGSSDISARIKVACDDDRRHDGQGAAPTTTGTDGGWTWGVSSWF